MSEQSATNSAPPSAAGATPGSAGGGSAAGSPPRANWKLAWQIPAMALGAAGLIAGGVYAFKQSPVPDYKGAIALAEGMLERREYVDAIEYANKNVYPAIELGLVVAEDVPRYHLLLARAISKGQEAQSLDIAENHRNVISFFDQARKLGADLTPEDTGMAARAHLALGELDRALEVASRLPERQRELRQRITKDVIERLIAGPRSGRSRAVELITDFAGSSDLSDADRTWALSRQAELLIDQGAPDEAIDRILRAMPRLSAINAPGLGEVLVRLAQAYMETRNYAAAAAQLDRAVELLAPDDPLLAKADLMSARVLESRDEPSEARDRYLNVLGAFPDLPEAEHARLGLAEIHAIRGEHGESLERYGELAKALIARKDRTPQGAVSRDAVVASLLSRFQERFEVDDDAGAMEYVLVAESLTGTEEASDDVIRALADVNKRLAEKSVEGVSGRSALAKAELDPATLQRMQRHHREAGKYFRILADRTVVTDPTAYGTALWSAADAFDRSGDAEKAIAAFDEFAKSFPDDPRQPEAIFRLAEAFKAAGDLGRAAELYRGLIESSERAGVAAAGPYSDASYVPLAQTYLLDDDPANDKEAEQRLLEVAGGRIGGTNTGAFREAVIELGNLYYQTGQHELGIERLREAVTRFPDDARLHQIRFKLAEVNRLSAAGIERELTEAMPESRRRELIAARSQRLRDAAEEYEQAAWGLESTPADRRTALDELMIRNAKFYMGDCAFDLGEYEAAIRYYDAAREKYPREPAALVAMVQIVSSHLRQGDVSRAMTANERAKRFYASLPEEVWNDPNLPMGRREWERWLDATSELGRLASSQDPGNSEEDSAGTRAGADGGGGSNAPPGGRADGLSGANAGGERRAADANAADDGRASAPR